MGAQLYYHTTPYTNDPAVALERLQSQLLDACDLPAMIVSHLASAQQAFDDTPENDEFGLHDEYKAELERAKVIAAEPIPDNFSRRLKLVRRLHAHTGQGIGNILDVEGIAGKNGTGWSAAKPLAPAELVAKFGSDRLLYAEAQQLAGMANRWLERGECVCFPLYSDVEQNSPSEWCFVGNTVD